MQLQIPKRGGVSECAITTPACVTSFSSHIYVIMSAALRGYRRAQGIHRHGCALQAASADDDSRSQLNNPSLLGCYETKKCLVGPYLLVLSGLLATGHTRRSAHTWKSVSPLAAANMQRREAAAAGLDFGSSQCDAMLDCRLIINTCPRALGR
jgi:hypothetical protein